MNFDRTKDCHCLVICKKMEESARSSKCRAMMVNGSFPRGLTKKTWNEIIREDFKVSKDQKYFENIRKKPSDPCKDGKRC